jgi:ribonuclease HI
MNAITLPTFFNCDKTKTPARLVIYINGACPGNPGPAGCGFVALPTDIEGNIINQLERKFASQFITTNKRAKLASAINALQFVKDRQSAGAWPHCPVKIVSDSQYVVSGFTKWLPSWMARNWRKPDGKEPDNRDLWERLLVAAAGLSVEWQWIKGHNGDYWNERAHALASAAAAEAKRNGVRFREAAK